MHVRIFVCMYENQYLPSSFTYFKKLLNNGFELVLRAFLVVVLINFTLLSCAATLVVVVVFAVVSAHIAAVTLSHTHALCEIQGVSPFSISFFFFVS